MLSVHGGVRRFSIKPAIFKGRIWPVLASSFIGLRHFKIGTIYDNIMIPATSDDILSLPRNLSSLSLKANNGISSFTKALLEQPDHFAQLKRLSLTRGAKDDCRNVDFKNTLPRRLQYLKFDTSWSDYEDFPHYITSPEFLPPTLTHLDIKTARIDVLEGHGFPSTLTKIRALVTDLDIDWMKLLPAGLLECHIEPFYCNASSAFHEWTSLPRGLTSLFVFMGYDKIEAHHLKALPPSITNLFLDACDSIDTALLPLLPPNLKTISGCLPDVVDLETAKNLPRSITDLHRNVEVHAIPFLPPSLTCLSLQNIVDDDLPAPLPRSLQTLEMNEMPKDAMNQSFYPPTLISLVVHCHVKTEFFSAFSPTLSMLVLSVNIDCTDYPNLMIEPLKQLSSLITLTTLRLSFSSIMKLTSESSSWLPRSLEHLVLGECEMESDWFSSLPRSLSILSLQVQLVKSDAMKHLERCCPQLSSMTLALNLQDDYKGPKPNPTIDCLLNLPLSLTECEISVNMNDQASTKLVTNDHLRQLPSRLTSLQIPASDDVTSDCLPFFPKSLTRFILSYHSPQWFLDHGLEEEEEEEEEYDDEEESRSGERCLPSLQFRHPAVFDPLAGGVERRRA